MLLLMVMIIVMKGKEKEEEVEEKEKKGRMNKGELEDAVSSLRLPSLSIALLTHS